MNWHMVEMLLNISFTASIIIGNLRRPHPAATRAEDEGSLSLAAYHVAIQWGGVIALVTSLWLLPERSRYLIWTIVLFVWMISNSWRRDGLRPVVDGSATVGPHEEGYSQATSLGG